MAVLGPCGPVYVCAFAPRRSAFRKRCSCTCHTNTPAEGRGLKCCTKMEPERFHR